MSVKKTAPKKAKKTSPPNPFCLVHVGTDANGHKEYNVCIGSCAAVVLIVALVAVTGHATPLLPAAAAMTGQIAKLLRAVF